MIREVLLPQVELTMESATIVKISVRVGDTVKAEQCLMEVETQKAVSEIPSPFAGVIRKICVKEGDTVPEKAVLCEIADSAGDDAGESASSAAAATVESPRAQKIEPSQRATPLARKVAQDLGVSLGAVSGTGAGGKIKRADIHAAIPAPHGPLRAAPAARKLARDRGIALREVTGTGPLGRIKVEDVRKFAGDGVGAPGQWTDFPPSRLALIAQMQRALAEIPQITVTRQMDVTPLSRKEEGITFTHRLILELAAALRAHPTLCTITDGRRFLRAPVSVAVAIDTPNGLVAPVLREVDLADVAKISARLKDYRQRAETRSLKNDELRDGPFAVTNLGMLGVDSFVPLVFHGQTAVLAVGRTTDGAAGRKIASFSLAVDHRVVDGAEAARFLGTLQKEILS